MTAPGSAPLIRPGPGAAVTAGPVLAASWLLRAAILLHAVGKFVSVFSMRHTQFGNFLFIELFEQRLQVADPYVSAVWVEKISVSLYLLAGLVVLFRPWWPLLVLMFGYALAEAIAGTLMAGYRFSEWTLPAHALRFLTPLALLALLIAPASAALQPWRLPATRTLLRVATAMVFVTHGLQAYLADPHFIDLILGTTRRIFGIRPTEAAVVHSLKIIAMVDFGVALALLVYPVPLFLPRRWWAEPCAGCPIRRTVLPALLAWTACWGFVTAGSRIASLGWVSGLPQYPELLDRASHFLAPLALWCLYAAEKAPAICRPFMRAMERVSAPAPGDEPPVPRPR
jgi:hypothetical protein